MSLVSVGRERAGRPWVPDEDVPGGLVGKRLGSYELVSFLGRGGMADVYGAAQVTGRSRARVAIKRMLPRLARLPRMVELFKHEARLGSRLNHPNLVRCIDFDIVDEVPFMVQEHVVGVPLDAALRWLAGRDGFPARLAVYVARSVARGLAHAHDARDSNGCLLGVVHQDVAPDNVLLSRDGEVKLADFGVAKSTLTPSTTSARELRGKLGYMSPEQAAGIATDARSDVFGVGVVLAELLLGRRLLAARDDLSLLIKNLEVVSDALSELESLVPIELARVVRQALAREPNARFQSASELERALRLGARALGEPAGAPELVLWLAEHGFVPAKSGVRERAARSVSGKVFAKKLAALPEVRGEALDPAPRALGATRLKQPIPRFGALLPDGHTVELVSLPELLSRVATGRASRETELVLDGGRRAALETVPALAFTAKLSGFQFDAEERQAEWVRPLWRPLLPKILFDLARERARGLLAFRSGPRVKHVYFEAGAPCFVAASAPDELLGARLVARGLLTPEELDETLALASRQGVHLGAALVNARLFAAGEMLRILLSELTTRVLELGSWPEGEVRFVRGARPGLLTPRPPGPPGALAARLARTAFCDAEIEAYLEPLDDAPIAKLDDAPLTFRPSPVERELLAHAERAPSLTELVRELGARGVEREAALRGVFVTLSAGLVRAA